MFGDNVTFSATVSVAGGDADRVGGVHDRRHAGCRRWRLVNGVATTCDVGVVGVGFPHTVRAAYTSDTGDWSDSSGALSAGQTVTAAFDVDGGGFGHNPSVFGDNVTFSATVSSGVGTPTGSVVFTIDGTAGRAGGAGQWCRDDLDVGVGVSGCPHTVHAAYTSDTGDWSASSGSLSDGSDGDGGGVVDGGVVVGHEPVGVR